MSSVKLLGKYYLQEKIATGGASQMFRGMEIGPNGFERMVLIHRLKDEFARDEEKRAELGRAVQRLQQFYHPSVARVLEMTSIREDYLVVLDWLNGTSLRAMLSRLVQAKQSLAPEECLYVVIELLRGLEAVEQFSESNGTILTHGRIHPDNVLIGYNGAPRLIGLGLESLYSMRESMPLDHVSLPYRSPEELQGKPIDPRADIFSIGCILFEMLTGKPLFLGNNNDETRHKIQEGLGLQQGLDRGLTRDIAPFICKSVEPRRDWRFLGASEALETLAGIAPRLSLEECKRRLATRLEILFQADLQKEQEQILEEHRTLARLLGSEPPQDEELYERQTSAPPKLNLDPWNQANPNKKTARQRMAEAASAAGQAALSEELQKVSNEKLGSLVFHEELSLSGFQQNARPDVHQKQFHALKPEGAPSAAPGSSSSDIVLASDLSEQVTQETSGPPHPGHGHQTHGPHVLAHMARMGLIDKPTPPSDPAKPISLVYNDEVPPIVAIPTHGRPGDREKELSRPTPPPKPTQTYDFDSLLSEEEAPPAPAEPTPPEMMEPVRRPPMDSFRPAHEKQASRTELSNIRGAQESREAWRKRLEGLNAPTPTKEGLPLSQILGIVGFVIFVALVVYFFVLRG